MHVQGNWTANRLFMKCGKSRYRGLSSTGGFSKTSTYGDRYEDDGYGGGS